jgi:predicted ester cyclase
MASPADIKTALAAYRAATAAFEPAPVKAALAEVMADDATLHLCHPFGDATGPDAFYATCLAPLHAAMPDLESREMILIAGTTEQGQDWAASMGSYMGTFLAPFLGIPPTGHLAHMRFHEYFKLENGKVTELQMIWDIPELMMQANAWPMAPQLGKFLNTPGPMTQDGLTATGHGSKAMQIVIDMLTDLCRHPGDGGPEVMNLDKYWHPRVNWYGPAGIGTARGMPGFRHWHQIPFLKAMPDRKLDAMGDLMSHWIAEGAYVAETGWPNMRLTITGDGWMGIAPANQNVLLRSLDFWRVEGDLIRENWVLVDLLDLYAQVGVDVLARMKDFNKARNIGPITLSDGMSI